MTNLIYSKKSKYIILLLIAFLAISCVKSKKLRIGFDVDDTILFSSPAFLQAERSDIKPFSKEYWDIVNSSDEKYSIIKKKTAEIIKKYLDNGDEVFAITARPDYNGEYLKNFLNKALNIPKENIFFEYDSKVERIKSLKLDYYYGDSDSDIEDALAAGAKPIRIQRSPNSNYKKKYNPGKYNEQIIENSAE